jgi:hypothetical protein
MKMKKHELLMAIRILIKIYDDEKHEATLSVLRSLLNLYYDLPPTPDYALIQNNTEYDNY